MGGYVICDGVCRRLCLASGAQDAFEKVARRHCLDRQACRQDTAVQQVTPIKGQEVAGAAVERPAITLASRKTMARSDNYRSPAPISSRTRDATSGLSLSSDRNLEISSSVYSLREPASCCIGSRMIRFSSSDTSSSVPEPILSFLLNSTGIVTCPLFSDLTILRLTAG